MNRSKRSNPSELTAEEMDRLRRRLRLPPSTDAAIARRCMSLHDLLMGVRPDAESVGLITDRYASAMRGE